jgi:hypothetical protein
MNDKNKDQANGQKDDPTWTEAQRLLTEIQQFRAQAEEQFKAAETSRKNADSEGLFAVNAKKTCEDHATAISQLKGTVESEVNAIHSNKQKSDELLAALNAGKATIDADAKTIGEERKEADIAASSLKTARENCESRVQEIDKSKTAAEEALKAITESREASSQAQKSAESSRGEVEKCFVDAQAKVKQIEDNHTSSTELRLEIQSALETAQASKTKIETVLEHLQKSDEISTGHEMRVAELTKELDLLLKRVDSLLPGAASASLASSFNAQKKRFADPQKRWLMIFIGCIVGLVVVALPNFLDTIGIPIWKATTNNIWEKLMLRMPVVIPLVWLAIYAGRNYMLSLRLEEEYAYKEAVSTAFEGYKREMKDIDAGEAANPSPLTKLCTNILAAIAERPGRIYEGKNRDITIPNEMHGAVQELAKRTIAKG